MDLTSCLNFSRGGLITRLAKESKLMVKSGQFESEAAF